MKLEPMSMEQVIKSVGEEVVVIDTGATYSSFDEAAERLGARELWHAGHTPRKGEIYKIINYVYDRSFHFDCLVLIGNGKSEFVIGPDGISLLQGPKMRSIW